jgi:nicotinate-nucleotide pyrophosphorylase (carboxylating)
MNTQKSIDQSEILKYALSKDQGPLGDVTSLALIPEHQLATAEFVVKAESGIVSGLNIAKKVYKLLDPSISFSALVTNGTPIKKGDILAAVSGPARTILVGERISLEFLRRMSGIATKTAHFVNETKGTNTVILDTRKILPVFGDLDKQAVKDGGGQNHRLNLSEMGLIKNNHLDILKGDIAKAIASFREKYPNIPLEIEVRDKKELAEALANNPDRIMLDNMNSEETKNSVATRNEYKAKTNKYIPLEASGNMTVDRIKEVADTGVDYISVGALTHSVEAFDISLHITFNN